MLTNAEIEAIHKINSLLTGDPEKFGDLSAASQILMACVEAETRVSEGASMIVESMPLGEVVSLEGAKGEGLIRIIAPGQGSSGFYPKEVLKRDGPKIFTPGTHMYYNHPTPTQEMERPEDDLHYQAGVLTSGALWQEDGPLGEGLYAKHKVFSDFKDRIRERAEYGCIGVSWRGFGIKEDGQVAGKVTKIFKELKRAISVDFVTRAGAGGAIVRASEAASRQQRRSMAKVEIEDTEHADLLAKAKEAAKVPGLEERVQKLMEANNKAVARVILDNKFKNLDMSDKAKEATINLMLGTLPIRQDGVLDSEKVAADATSYAESFGTVRESGNGNGSRVQLPGSSAGSKEKPTKEAQIAQFKRYGLSDDEAKRAVEAGGDY